MIEPDVDLIIKGCVLTEPKMDVNIWLDRAECYFEVEFINYLGHGVSKIRVSHNHIRKNQQEYVQEGSEFWAIIRDGELELVFLEEIKD